MKIIKSGDEYRVATNGVKITERIPTGVYEVEYKENEGTALVRSKIDFSTSEKLYGDINDKITKILRVWEHTDRNLGVLLSGMKGQGKSISSKEIIRKMLARDIPAICVTKPIPDLPKFINSIEQPLVVFFDEFEKVFSGGVGSIYFNPKADTNTRSVEDSQHTLLGMFDGLGCKDRRLWIITCNNINYLDDNLINRPGRFHFHLKFSGVKEDEIVEYMTDHLDKKYYSEIDKVLKFSASSVPLNYDCLRALCDEMNLGYPFEEVIGTLNIIPQGAIVLQGYVLFANGSISDTQDVYIAASKFSETSGDYMSLNVAVQGNWLGNVSVGVKSLKYDRRTHKYTVDPKDLPIFIPRDIQYQTPEWKVVGLEFTRKNKYDDKSY